jgi:DNA-binding transcriptional LysR family regulator
MDASEIEVFLALAQELHFGRTAERLWLSQSRVSRLTASLERRVGGPLFERTSRQVMLTPLGKQLLGRIGPAWTELEGAFAEARSAARGTGGTLRLGWPVTASGPASSLLAELFSASCPDCELLIHDVPVTDVYGPLRRGEIDVLAHWLTEDEPGLTAGPVVEYRERVLAVGRGHQLAGRETVSVEDLACEDVHDGSLYFPAGAFGALVPPRAPSGRPVPRVNRCRGAEEVLVLIARGRLVQPAVAGVPLFQRDDIRLIPVRGLPPLPLGLIWRTGCENARIRALAGVARRVGPSAAHGG